MSANCNSTRNDHVHANRAYKTFSFAHWLDSNKFLLRQVLSKVIDKMIIFGTLHGFFWVCLGVNLVELLVSILFLVVGQACSSKTEFDVRYFTIVRRLEHSVIDLLVLSSLILSFHLWWFNNLIICLFLKREKALLELKIAIVDDSLGALTSLALISLRFMNLVFPLYSLMFSFLVNLTQYFWHTLPLCFLALGLIFESVLSLLEQTVWLILILFTILIWIIWNHGLALSKAWLNLLLLQPTIQSKLVWLDYVRTLLNLFFRVLLVIK